MRGLFSFKILSILVVFTLLFSVTLMAQEPEPEPSPFAGNFVFAGLAYDADSSPNVKAVTGIAIPASDKWLIYTAVQTSAVEGTTFKDLFNTSSLITSVKTGPSYHVYRIAKGVNLWGLAQGGLAAGGPNPSGTSIPLSGSFAYGGFVDIALKHGFGIVPAIQHDWDAKTGWKLLPTVMIRYELK